MSQPWHRELEYSVQGQVTGSGGVSLHIIWLRARGLVSSSPVVLNWGWLYLLRPLAIRRGAAGCHN